MSETTIKARATFEFAKALHHINAAQHYIDLVIIESGATFSAKEFLKFQKKRLEKVFTEFEARITDKSMISKIKDDLKDELAIDAYKDIFIGLSPEARLKLEDYMLLLLNESKTTSNVPDNSQIQTK